MKTPQHRLWAARLLIVTVLTINLLCAFEFILRPSVYQGSYELDGEVGKAVIIGFGILFLMWQVPYFFALANPVKHKVSLISAVIMQAIGLIGESLLLHTIPDEHTLLRGSVIRFIIFDGAGLVLLFVALYLVRLMPSPTTQE